MIITEKPFERVKSPLIHHIYRLWRDKRGSRRMPSRADFDPLEMPKLLPSIILVDVETPDRRLKVRLAGTKVVDMFGRDYTGEYLDEIDFGDVREKVLHEYGLAASEERPIFSDHAFRNAQDFHHSIERAILPLADDGATVNMLLAVLAFELLLDPPSSS